jgi:hypothetical protein
LRCSESRVSRRAVALAVASILTAACGSRSSAPGAAAASHKDPADGSPEIVARFVGTVAEVSLPHEPVEVIPIGYDAHFALSVNVVRVMEGSLPGKGRPVRFLIHSPALFFFENLGPVPTPKADYPQGEFVFTLLMEGAQDGARRYNLRMAPLPNR